jgi:hypothetical protein
MEPTNGGKLEDGTTGEDARALAQKKIKILVSISSSNLLFRV